MKKYWNNLKEHPGVEFAFILTVMFFGAALSNKSLSIEHAIIVGAIGSGVPWAIVLTTNYTNNK